MINDYYAKKIKELSYQKMLLLGLCYAERSQKIVKKFDDVYSEELSEHFISKLDQAYNSLLCESYDMKELDQYQKELEEIIPDTDDYPGLYGGLAVNGLAMLCYCYRYMLTQKSENILYTINLGFEIMDAICYETKENYSYEIECQIEFVLLEKYLIILDANQEVDIKVLAKLREMNSINMFAL